MAKTASKKTTTTKKTSAKKPAPKSASTEKAHKAAIAEIDQRLAGGRQDHEVPTAKETANDAALAAYAATKAPKAPKATTPRKPAKDAARANVVAHKRPSALDLAAKAVAESKEPMSARALAERAMAEGWKTSGRTPEATIYSAIIREIKAKGPASRFAKASRGTVHGGQNVRPRASRRVRPGIGRGVLSLCGRDLPKPPVALKGPSRHF